MDVPNVVDSPTYGVQQRRAAPGEILLLRHERHLGKGQAVVDDHALIVKQHGGDQEMSTDGFGLYMERIVVFLLKRIRFRDWRLS